MKNGMNPTKDRLFAEATRLFREKGYSATSMADIASAVGIQKASIYYYVKSKQELLVEVARKCMNMLLEEAERIAYSNLNPTDKLKAIIRGHIRLIVEYLDIFTVSLRDINPLNMGPHWPEAVALRDHYESIIRGIIRAGIKTGEFKNIDEKLAGFALLGMVNWLIRWVKPNGEKSADEIASVMTEIFLSGLRAGSSGESEKCKQSSFKLHRKDIS
ncbi:MAG: TetR family transcriptional regulator [Deltaproteobacteria bacterium]|nr:TetR family transcriptional regulator [Deltaproteobacteria bacterium]MBW2068562.1 TetR family transcriptional regulator [Deltaproteobacteria bacterium]